MQLFSFKILKDLNVWVFLFQSNTMSRLCALLVVFVVVACLAAPIQAFPWPLPFNFNKIMHKMTCVVSGPLQVIVPVGGAGCALGGK